MTPGIDYIRMNILLLSNKVRACVYQYRCENMFRFPSYRSACPGVSAMATKYCKFCVREVSSSPALECKSNTVLKETPKLYLVPGDSSEKRPYFLESPMTSSFERSHWFLMIHVSCEKRRRGKAAHSNPRAFA